MKLALEESVVDYQLHDNANGHRAGYAMLRHGPSDKSLQAECLECRTLHADYVEGCQAVEQAELLPAPGNQMDQATEWATNSRRTWLAAVRRAMSIPAHTSDGVMAKALILTGMVLEVCADSEEVVFATMALEQDLHRLVRQERGPPRWLAGPNDAGKR